MKPRRLAARDLAARSYLWKTPGGHWLATTPTELVALDKNLDELCRFPKHSSWRGWHSLSVDLSFAVVSGKGQVFRVNRDGKLAWKTAHEPWGQGDSESGSTWISGAHVWVTVPTEEGPDEWWVLEAATGRVLARAALECHAAGSETLGHPDGRHVGLAVGEGQDAAEVYWGRFEAGAIITARLDDLTRVLCDIHPSGQMFLTTPHSDALLRVHAFPGGAVLAERAAEEDDGLDFQAAYVTADRVLAPQVESGEHLLLDSRTLDLVDRVVYPSGAATGGVLSYADGRWLTWDHLSGKIQLWTL